MTHLIQCLGAGIIISIVGVILLAKYSKSKPSDIDEGDRMPHIDPEHRIGEDNIPTWKKAK
jgi:hypothetical protein